MRKRNRGRANRPHRSHSWDLSPFPSRIPPLWLAVAAIVGAWLCFAGVAVVDRDPFGEELTT